MKKYFVILILPLAMVMVLAGCGQKPVVNNESSENIPEVIEGENLDEQPNNEPVSLPNPASANCVKLGGKLVLVEGVKGQYGICYFEDNRQCEEWAMFRGDCPIGGVKVTGYDNDAQIYCAIRGGQVNMDKNICTLKSGEEKDIDEYYEE